MSNKQGTNVVAFKKKVALAWSLKRKQLSN